MSRSEPLFMTKTLEIFYRTMLACGYSFSEIAAKLEAIEKQHGMPISELHQNGSRKKDRVKVSEDDIAFLRQLAEDWKTNEFCKFAKIGYDTVMRIKSQGWCSTRIYKRLQRGIKRWEAKCGLENNN